MNRTALMAAARRLLANTTANIREVVTCMDESIVLPDSFSGTILNFSLREGEELIRDEENKRQE